MLANPMYWIVNASLLAQMVAQAMRVVGVCLSLSCCSVVSLCSSVSNVCLSLLCCKAATLSSKDLVALMALSLILHFLNLSSFCSAISDAWRALSLFLFWGETCWLWSLQIQKIILRLNPLIHAEDRLEVESMLPSILPGAYMSVAKQRGDSRSALHQFYVS